MTYQSPLHIIKGFGKNDDEFNQFNIIRLRKKLLADLNLSGETTIVVNKKEYSKDEIIKTFDTLLNDPQLNLHEFIYSKKDLLTYLENEDMFYSFNSFSKLEIPDEYRLVVMNMLEDRFMVQYKRAMSKRDFIYAKQSVLFIDQLDENRREKYYDAIHKNLTSLKNFIDEITILIKTNENNNYWVLDQKEKGLSQADSIRFLADIKLADLLNSLPADFNETINALLNRIISLMFHYHKQPGYDKKMVSKISYMLMKVRKCGDAEYKTIRSNHRIFSNDGSPRFFSFTQTNTNGIGFVIAFVLITLARVYFFSSNTDNTNFSNVRFDTNSFRDGNSVGNKNGNIQYQEIDKMSQFIKDSIHYPKEALKNGTQGTVHVSFTIEPNGEVSDVKALDSIGDGCEEEAVRAVKSVPWWRTILKTGKPTQMKYNLPIKFTIE